MRDRAPPADAPWRTFDELIAAAKKEPDKYNYATSGIGGTGQLTMIEVEQSTGPYGLVGPKDLPPPIVEAVHQAFRKAMADPRVDALLDSYIQAPW